VSEGQPVRFTATVSVRPEVQLGSYTDYPFGLEIPETTDEQVEQVINELRGQQATLRPVDDRPTAYACIGPVCSLPVTEPDALLDLLRRQRMAQDTQPSG
jgi:hypothetical protein